MANILIRDIPENVASALTEKAQAVGKDRMAYIRALLIKDAAEPVVKERYAYRFVSDTGLASGIIRRFGDKVESVGVTGVTVEGLQVIGRVEVLMRRNNPGDREEALYLLKHHFNNVFEIPV